MFGSKKNENTVKKSTSNGAGHSHALNSLVQGTIVKGTVSSESDIRVDGTLEGDLQCSSKLIIGPSGMISGDVTCENALIEGAFSGNLVVRGTLHVKDNAKIQGDVTTGKLIVDQDATFNVRCNMGGMSSSSNSKSKSKEKLVKEAVS